MSNEEYVDLGYEAASNIASRVNAGNASDFAAKSIAADIQYAVIGIGKIDYSAICKLQDRCRIDLSPILLLDDKEQCKAFALFAAGAWKYHKDNPD
jgi:hypothetical protein